MFETRRKRIFKADATVAVRDVQIPRKSLLQNDIHEAVVGGFRLRRSN